MSMWATMYAEILLVDTNIEKNIKFNQRSEAVI